jgi:hypothetical protein
VARLRRIFWDFSLAPLVEDGSPGDVQKCEIYARHAQFTRPLSMVGGKISLLAANPEPCM